MGIGKATALKFAAEGAKVVVCDVMADQGQAVVAEIVAGGGEAFFAVSMYGVWERPHELTRSTWIVADGSVHRLISDLSALVGQQYGHRILAAGDLNILRGYGEGGSMYCASRYETVFARMKALGLPFVGPQAPGGRRAELAARAADRAAAGVDRRDQDGCVAPRGHQNPVAQQRLAAGGAGTGTGHPARQAGGVRA